MSYWGNPGSRILAERHVAIIRVEIRRGGDQRIRRDEGTDFGVKIARIEIHQSRAVLLLAREGVVGG